MPDFNIFLASFKCSEKTAITQDLDLRDSACKLVIFLDNLAHLGLDKVIAGRVKDLLSIAF